MYFKWFVKGTIAFNIGAVIASILTHQSQQVVISSAMMLICSCLLLYILKNMTPNSEVKHLKTFKENEEKFFNHRYDTKNENGKYKVINVFADKSISVIKTEGNTIIFIVKVFKYEDEYTMNLQLGRAEELLELIIEGEEETWGQ